MSIERRQRKKKGLVYIVWWRDGARMRNRTFDRKRDADAYEAKIKLAKRRGDLDDLDAGMEPLHQFVDEWWALYAEPRLAPSTLRFYAGLRDRYLIPRLGNTQLRRLTAETVQRFQLDLANAGVGDETIRKALVLLQGILERAVEWGRLTVNPVRVVKKPRQKRRRAVRPLAPIEIEKLRGQLLLGRRQRDAALISLLAYAGLRPGEALALTWGDVGTTTLLIDKALALGEVKETKTRRARIVKLLKPLAADLAEWRLASGRPDETELIFPLRDGRPWTDSAFRNWRRRRFTPAAQELGLTNMRPYDLRHSFASLLFVEGINPVEIAEQMGHSLQMLLSTYTHVIEELRGGERQSAEELIKQAREEMLTQCSHTGPGVAIMAATVEGKQSV
jgi:integrase